MALLGKNKKIRQEQTAVRSFCLQTIRFNKFLENARALLDLFADGREKLVGEYIFDRHYVISLIDSVIDRLGMMVFDACVLVPEEGESLFAVFDRWKQTARDLIDQAHTAGGGEDPEYRLLADALEIFNGKPPAGQETITAFMKQAFCDVIEGTTPRRKNGSAVPFEYANLLATDRDIYLIDLWQDAVDPPSRRRVAAEVNSIPLRHLLLNGNQTATGRTASAGDAGAVPWMAAVGEYQLSLNRLSPDGRFRLEALASGHVPSDFIFAYSGQPGLLEKMLPSDFHVEPSPRGEFAWRLNMSGDEIEQSLSTIGRNIFDNNLWPVQG